tara:strand:- start:685 stop:825 length:141 start_codon:yes stop_codon:yes gene_type:complete
MADNGHKHGEMDIRAQEEGFNGFVKLLTYGGIVCIAILVILALFFR